MTLPFIIAQILVLVSFLLLKYSCYDQEKNNLKLKNMYTTKKEYYQNNPSKKQSMQFANIAILGLTILILVAIANQLFFN